MGGGHWDIMVYTRFSFLQENTPNKDFVLLHIKFDPPELARFWTKTTKKKKKKLTHN